jgi:hypothetical protein
VHTLLPTSFRELIRSFEPLYAKASSVMFALRCCRAMPALQQGRGNCRSTTQLQLHTVLHMARSAPLHLLTSDDLCCTCLHHFGVLVCACCCCRAPRLVSQAAGGPTCCCAILVLAHTPCRNSMLAYITFVSHMFWLHLLSWAVPSGVVFCWLEFGSKLAAAAVAYCC